MKVSGKVFKYGDNIDTDVIIPARYLTSADPEHLKEHCMEDIDLSFKDRVKSGDIMVAGKNFGCGSSREHAPVAIKASGISLVIADDFARIFYRNSINVGLPILECPEAAQKIKEKDEYRLKINTKKDKPILSENQREENILNSIILIYLLLLILFNF